MIFAWRNFESLSEDTTITINFLKLNTLFATFINKELGSCKLKISSNKNAMRLISPKSYSEKVTVLKKHRILTKRSPGKAVARNKYLL